MLGERLRELRQKRGMTQRDLARLLGITDAAVGMWENNRREPDGDKLSQLASIFGVSVDYLLGHTNIPRPNTESDPTPANLEDFLKQQEVKFYGMPLTDDEKADLLEALKLLWRRHHEDSGNQS